MRCALTAATLFAIALAACSSGGDGPTNAAPACSADAPPGAIVTTVQDGCDEGDDT